MDLVSCEWLQSQLSGNRPDHLIVVDASWRYDGQDYSVIYRDGHIPASVYFDIARDVKPDNYFPTQIPSKEGFQNQARQLGINSDSHVVLYEKSEIKYPLAAARAWFLFKYYGHDKVSILNGGLWEWLKLGYPVEKGKAASKTNGNFTTQERTSLIKSYEDMKNIVKNKASDTAIVDVRNAEFFRGDYDEPSKYIKAALEFRGYEPDKIAVHKGHIPGSVSIPHLEFLDIDTEYNKYRTPDVWPKVFESHAVDISKPVVFTCHLGMTACTTALIANQLGCKDWSVYIGSWTEWAQKSPADQCVTN